jgi:translation initiation factor IF-2
VPTAARPVPRPAPARRSEQGAPAPRPTPPPPPPLPEVFTEIAITERVTIKELSEKMDRKAKDIISRLLAKGIFANINQPLDTKTATEVCKEFGFDAKVVSFEEEVAREEAEVAVAENLRPRDPVVTIMGHVDHGKTSLLDAIRESNIVASEAGGITQHIGAYHIRRKDRGITFIDTPGHEAFTLMRARGARVTDIVVLVVAADDGVMPQTIEAMDHAKAAGVALVVAINKVDKPGANLDRVKKQLSDHGLLVEDWGGQVVAVPVSAKAKTGINELLEMLLLVTDIADLKADATSLASGTVLESRLDKSRGPVATILVQRGTLRVGDPFIAGAVHGKVRAMFDDLGHRIREAGPSIPAEVLGLEGVPGAGDPFQVLEEEWKVRQIGAFRQQKLRQEAMAKSSRLTLDQLYAQIKEGMVKELPLIVKADVQGSVEALTKTLQDLPSDKVKTKIIHAGSGAITETDVLLASASNAIVIGYNVRPERGAQDLAEKEKVDIRLHSVIYDITNEIKNAMIGLLEPEAKEVYLGRAEVRQPFKVPKVGMIAGCHVSDGRIIRSAEVRLLRDNVVVYTGKVSSLRRFKEDAGEVKAGYECGIGLANFNDLKVGDVIEAFRVDKIAAESL